MVICWLVSLDVAGMLDCGQFGFVLQVVLLLVLVLAVRWSVLDSLV